MKASEGFLRTMIAVQTEARERGYKALEKKIQIVGTYLEMPTVQRILDNIDAAENTPQWQQEALTSLFIALSTE